MSRLHRSSTRPLVLLLGWLGSRERHFNVYQRLWRDLGAQVIGHQPSVLQTAAPAVADRALLRFMRSVNYRYSSMCTVAGDTPPVLVHTMSNAGFIAYGTMLHLVAQLKHVQPHALSAAAGGTPLGATASSSSSGRQLEFDPAAWAAGGGDGGMPARGPGGAAAAAAAAAAVPRGSGDQAAGREGVHPFAYDPPSMAVLSAFRQILSNTEGIVIDSAPSQATPHIWSRGLVAAVMAEPAHSIEESHPLMVRSVRRVVERYFQLPRVAQRMREVRHAWQYNVPPCPQLYLYSKADALIPYQHIEHFMDQQAAHGVPVHHHCWADTAHCEHYRKHPEQYRSLVRSFSEHCMHSNTPPETWI